MKKVNTQKQENTADSEETLQEQVNQLNKKVDQLTKQLRRNAITSTITRAALVLAVAYVIHRYANSSFHKSMQEVKAIAAETADAIRDLPQTPEGLQVLEEVGLSPEQTEEVAKVVEEHGPALEQQKDLENSFFSKLPGAKKILQIARTKSTGTSNPDAQKMILDKYKDSNPSP